VFKPLIRLFAFYGKEFNEVRRQPRLVLSLILGPFLILLLFGVGYKGTPPPLRIALVIPESEMSDPRVERVKQIIEDNFVLVATIPDEQEANRMLDQGRVDVIEVFPEQIEEKLTSGQQVWVAFRYDKINPIDEQWLKYTGYVQVNALNQAILMQTASQMQDEAAEANIMLSVAREQLDHLDENSSEQERAQTRQTVQELQAVVAVLAANPATAEQVLGPDTDPAELQKMSENLQALDQVLATGDIEENREQINETRDQIDRMEGITHKLSTTPSQSLVQPLMLDYQNVRGKSLDLVNFYAPGVLALILQHIAVTLGALSLIREKLLGALEMFGVAPTSMSQVLLGKISAYTVLIGIIALLLTLLLVLGLHVPFLGSITFFVVTMALFILASISMGLMLSTLANSDTQAVQLSMIVLLVSIFFSGFFLPLEQFHPFAWWIGYMLPITHAMQSFNNIMLLGRPPTIFNWMCLLAIFTVTILFTMMLWGRQFRRLQ
jgi:ABC-2 type transport system permease protein